MELENFPDLQEGTIDTWIVMEEAKDISYVLTSELGKRANPIYFTPSTSHTSPGREQKIKGDYNPNNSAIITDISFWEGNSLNETLNVMESKGYNLDKIYAHYLFGYSGPLMSDSPHFRKETFGKARDVQELIKENHKLHSNLIWYL